MHKVVVIPGDGIGPEVVQAAVQVLNATGVLFEWETWPAGEEAIQKFGDPLPPQAITSIRRAKIALKGPVTTPVGGGFRSVNVRLRAELGLYANMRHIKLWPGVRSRYDQVDIAVLRENIEDLYMGIERWVDNDTAETVKRITRKGSLNIARYAFSWASRNGRSKVTAVHKANIMKLTDGLFLECCREVAALYPSIQYEERIIDNVCMQLVINPAQFDVLLCPNLYGDILSDMCAGLAGGLGLVPGMNAGDDCYVFEPAHGSVPKYAGLGRADPGAMILSGALLLDHIGERRAASAVREAFAQVVREGRHTTPDLGGRATTQEMASACAARTALILGRT